MCFSEIIYEKRFRNPKGNGSRLSSSETQVKANFTPCCLCRIGTAPAEKELIILPEGKKAHYTCVLLKAFAKLAEAGLPRPTRYSSPADLWDYLNEQAGILFPQPFNNVRGKLEAVMELSEGIFGKPVNVSFSMARQSSGDATSGLGNFA